MDLLSALRVLGRQWLTLSLALLMVVASVYFLAQKLPPTYQATATILVLPPKQGGVYQPPDKLQPPGKVVNPYLSFDSSDYVLARLATRVLSSSDTKARLIRMGAGTNYQVTTSSEEPVIDIVVTDSDPLRTVKTRDALVEIVRSELATRQQATGVPMQTWATATPVVMPRDPSETTASVKVLTAAAALGVVAAIGLAFAVESISVGLRRRRTLPTAGPVNSPHPRPEPPRFTNAPRPPPPIRSGEGGPNHHRHHPAGISEPGSKS
jgi:capsular polysaccharide biosynthesis protein